MLSLITNDHIQFAPLLNILFQKTKNFSCLYTPLCTLYNQAYFQKNYQNCTALVLFNETPISALLLTRTKDDNIHELNYFGMPSQLVNNQNASINELELAHNLLSKYFSDFIQYKKISLTYLSDQSVLNSFEILLMTLGAQTKHKFSQHLNIEKTPEDLKKDIRKSYKSLINWGFKNIQFEVLDQTNANLEKFLTFKDLHIKVAGRQTRSDETWIKQFEMIQNDEAFAILGYLEGQLVTSSLFNYFQKHCYYSVSASVRELFDKPLLHSSIWKAIEIAKNKGCNEFELGEQVFTITDNVSKKEIDISYFKRGFGGRTQINTLFLLQTYSS